MQLSAIFCALVAPLHVGVKNSCGVRSTTPTASVAVAADPVLNNPIFLDEAAMLKEKAFKLAPEELIALSKKFLVSRGGFGADPELLSEDFKL